MASIDTILPPPGASGAPAGSAASPILRISSTRPAVNALAKRCPTARSMAVLGNPLVSLGPDQPEVTSSGAIAKSETTITAGRSMAWAAIWLFASLSTWVQPSTSSGSSHAIRNPASRRGLGVTIMARPPPARKARRFILLLPLAFFCRSFRSARSG